MQEKNSPSYRQLFFTFFRIGITAFGGLAMTAHIRKHIVDKTKWLDGNTFDSGLALCQLIPGAIVMQLVAYIGLKKKGIPGAVISFIAFGLTSFLVMLALSVLYKHSQNIAVVEKVLSGLRIIIVAIVANAAYLFGKKNFENVNDWIIAILAAGLFSTKLHPAFVLVIAAFAGLIITNKNLDRPIKVDRIKTFKFFLIVLISILAIVGILFVFNKEYFNLTTIMLRIDLFSFGGGLASIPIMYHELVEVFGWFDKKTFMDGVVLGQVTPGSIIIAATFFGYMHFGFLGSFFATACVFIPSFLILMGIIPFFDKLRSYPQFNKVINGILCSFVGLLAVVTYRFTNGIDWSIFHISLALIAFILLIRKVDVIWIILGEVAISLIIT